MPWYRLLAILGIPPIGKIMGFETAPKAIWHAQQKKCICSTSVRHQDFCIYYRIRKTIQSEYYSLSLLFAQQRIHASCRAEKSTLIDLADRPRKASILLILNATKRKTCPGVSWVARNVNRFLHRRNTVPSTKPSVAYLVCLNHLSFWAHKIQSGRSLPNCSWKYGDKQRLWFTIKDST
jgi:hypothetical protein